MNEKITLSAEERETIVQFDNSSKIATAYTRNHAWRNKLKKLADKYPEDVSVILDDYAWNEIEISFPKAWLKISPTRKYNLTDEQRKIRAERLKKSLNRT